MSQSFIIGNFVFLNYELLLRNICTTSLNRVDLMNVVVYYPYVRFHPICSFINKIKGRESCYFHILLFTCSL